MLQKVVLVVLFVVLASAAACVSAEPHYPVWPGEFTTFFDVLVPNYGKDFVKKGALFYDYQFNRRARADYYDWCIPLFDGTNGGNSTDGLYNHTCSFLMNPNGTYFISPDFPIKEDRCCYFAFIPPPTPDWLKNTVYNKTEVLRGQRCDKWWFDGTSDPDNPYYGYWDRAADQVPVRFLGLSSIGVTILDYQVYKPGRVPNPNMMVVPPNCQAECVSPPVVGAVRRLQERQREGMKKSMLASHPLLLSL